MRTSADPADLCRPQETHQTSQILADPEDPVRSLHTQQTSADRTEPSRVQLQQRPGRSVDQEQEVQLL